MSANISTNSQDTSETKQRKECAKKKSTTRPITKRPRRRRRNETELRLEAAHCPAALVQPAENDTRHLMTDKCDCVAVPTFPAGRHRRRTPPC